MLVSGINWNDCTCLQLQYWYLEIRCNVWVWLWNHILFKTASLSASLFRPGSCICLLCCLWSRADSQCIWTPWNQSTDRLLEPWVGVGWCLWFRVQKSRSPTREATGVWGVLLWTNLTYRWRVDRWRLLVTGCTFSISPDFRPGKHCPKMERCSVTPSWWESNPA